MNVVLHGPGSTTALCKSGARQSLLIASQVESEAKPFLRSRKIDGPLAKGWPILTEAGQLPLSGSVHMGLARVLAAQTGPHLFR